MIGVEVFEEFLNSVGVDGVFGDPSEDWSVIFVATGFGGDLDLQDLVMMSQALRTANITNNTGNSMLWLVL